MSSPETVGSRLLELKARSGLSLQRIAELGGYRGRSSVQRVFTESFDPGFLTPAMMTRLRAAFVGQGNPPITEDEVNAVGESFPSADPIRKALRRLSYDSIFIHRTSVSPLSFHDMKGHLVDTFLRGHTYIELFSPNHLKEREVFGLNLAVTTMTPKYEYGDTIFVELEVLPKSGRDIFLVLDQRFEEQNLCCLGRLLEVRGDHFRIVQIDSGSVFSIDREAILEVGVILTPMQLLTKDVLD